MADPKQQQQQQQQQRQHQFPETQMMPNTVAMTSQALQQPNIGYVTAQRPVNLSIAENYNAQHSKGLGITLIIVGVLSIVFNSTGLAAGSLYGIVAHGFWCGFIFILTGSIGVGASSKNRGMINTFLVLAIISAILACAMFGIALTGALMNGNCYDPCPDNEDLAIASEFILAILAVVAALVSIWVSVICCQAVGCCAPSQNGAVAVQYENQQTYFSQPPGTNHYVNPQMFTVSASSSPVNQMQRVPYGYPGP